MTTEPRSNSRETKALESRLGTERTISDRDHGPVTVRVQEATHAAAEVEVESSEGSWRCPVTDRGIVEEIVAADDAAEESPHWVSKLLENLGFREVPGSTILI